MLALQGRVGNRAVVAALTALRPRVLREALASDVVDLEAGNEYATDEMSSDVGTSEPAPTQPSVDATRTSVETLLARFADAPGEAAKRALARQMVDAVIDAYRLSRKGLQMYSYDSRVTAANALTFASDQPGESRIAFGPGTFDRGFAWLVAVVAHELEHVSQNVGRAAGGNWRASGSYASEDTREFMAYTNTVLQLGPYATPSGQGPLALLDERNRGSQPHLPPLDPQLLATQASQAMVSWKTMTEPERGQFRQQFDWVRDKLFERFSTEAPIECRPPEQRSGAAWEDWVNEKAPEDPIEFANIPSCGDWQAVKDEWRHWDQWAQTQ